MIFNTHNGKFITLPSDDELSKNGGSSAGKDVLLSGISIGVLNEIGRRCESKVVQINHQFKSH